MAGRRQLPLLLGALLILATGSVGAATGSGEVTVTGALDVDGTLLAPAGAGALYAEAAPGHDVTIALDGAVVNVTRVTLIERGLAGVTVMDVEREQQEFTRARVTTSDVHSDDARIVLESESFHADATTATLDGPSIVGVTKFVGVLGARGGEADMATEEEGTDYKFLVQDAFLAQTSAPSRVDYAADSLILYVYGADVTIQADGAAATFTTGTDAGAPAAGASRERSFLVIRVDGAAGTAATSGASAHWFQRDLTAAVDGAVTAADARGNVRVDGRDHPARDEALTVGGALDLTLSRTTAATETLGEYGRTFDPEFRANIGGDVTYVSVAAAGSSYPAAAAVVAGGLAGIAVAALFWQQVKYWLTVAFLPLYTRLKEPEILDNEARNQIYEIIRTNPGISARAIHRAAGQSWGTVVYHLRQLERHHLVTSKRVGRSRNYYENHGKYRGMEVELATLKAPRALQIAELVMHEPGLTQERLTELSGFPQPTTSYYVRKLKDAGLIEEERSGRYAHYFPSAELARLVQIARADDPPGGTEPRTASTA